MFRPVLAAVLLIAPFAAQAEEGGISGLFGNTCPPSAPMAQI